MKKCITYEELEILVQSLIAEGLPPLDPRVNTVYVPGKHIQDVIAQCETPETGQYNVTAVKTTADGNYLSRAFSTAHFDTQERHMEVRARMVIEGIVNKNKYISHQYLSRGAAYLHLNAELPTVSHIRSTTPLVSM